MKERKKFYRMRRVSIDFAPLVRDVVKPFFFSLVENSTRLLLGFAATDGDCCTPPLLARKPCHCPRFADERSEFRNAAANVARVAIPDTCLNIGAKGRVSVVMTGGAARGFDATNP